MQGQDVYHHQKYNSYQRFRLKHFFMAEPNANLHIAILEIVKELRKVQKYKIIVMYFGLIVLFTLIVAFVLFAGNVVH